MPNYNSQTFTNNLDIDKFFQSIGATDFSSWFNSNIPQTSPWQKDYLGSPQKYKIVKNQWEIIWANLSTIFGRNSINLVEFICMNSIMTNETGGSFIPKSEGSNKSTSPIPGIAYEFNKIAGKSSYNTNSGNINAYTLFNDTDYIAAHGTKGLSTLLKNTTNSAWQGSTFPLGFASSLGFTYADETSSSGVKNGFLIEADFFKFRGRGFIQTTTRNNYNPLVQYVINYSGNDSIVNQVKQSWSVYGNNISKILSSSTNSDWDSLFNTPNNTIANYAVYIHNKNGGNYNTINSNQAQSGLQISIKNMGAKIAGGSPSDPYPTLFYDRVMVQLDLINSGAPPSSSSTIATMSPTASQSQGRLARTSQDPNSQVGNSNNITGSLSIVTNLFGPTIKPGPIKFDIN